MTPIQKFLKESEEKFEEKFMKDPDTLDVYFVDNPGVFELKSFLRQSHLGLLEVVEKMIDPTEIAERIVIEYANQTGREDKFRPYVRAASLKALSDFLALIREGKE